MSTTTRCSVLRGLAVATMVIASGCASSGPTPTAETDSRSVAGETRMTQQEAQSALMAFSDRYFAVTLDAARALELGSATPEDRYTTAAARFLALMVTTDIAASPNPAAAVLDMTVLVTLKRTVFEDYWMPEVFGEKGLPVLDAYLELEQDIWGIAAAVYTPEQLSELRTLVDNWRAEHPDVVNVDYVRLAELGDSRQVRTLVDAGRSGGMLAPVREANRNIEEMRMLSERLVFMATRMQMSLTLQVEMASAKLASLPESRQLIEDSRTFAEVSDRVAETFAALVADLPEERRAAIDQVMSGLNAQREALLADLSNENGELRPALHDLHQTLETGRQLAEVLGETIGATDLLLAGIEEASEGQGRPFDIVDYQKTLAEATVTVREVQTVLMSIERLLGSAGAEGQMAPILESANRFEDEVVDEILTRAFLYGVALILIFFLALLVYRVLATRLSANRSVMGVPAK